MTGGGGGVAHPACVELEYPTVPPLSCHPALLLPPSVTLSLQNIADQERRTKYWQHSAELVKAELGKGTNECCGDLLIIPVTFNC